MPTPDIRPLSFGELLDRTFSYYRRHFWTFAGIMAIPQFTTFLIPLLLTLAPVARSGLLRGLPSAVAFLVSVMVFIFLAGVLGAMAYGAVTMQVSEIQLGRSLTIRESYRRPLKRAGGLIGLCVLFWLLLFAGAITLVLPILMCLWYAFAIPVLLEEKTSPPKALERSRQLTKGHRGNVFAIAFLMFLVVWIATVIAGLPTTIITLVMAAMKLAVPIWLQMLSFVLQGGMGALTSSLAPIGLALLYYDVRMKKEGYDLQVMMENLGPEQAQDQTFQAPA